MKERRLLLLLLILSTVITKAQNLDIALLNKFNPNNASSENAAWKFMSDRAIYMSAATPVALMAVGLATHDQKLKQTAFTTGMALAGNTVLTMYMKKTIQRQRPFVTWADRVELQGNTSPTDYSFPSGHTSTVFAVATSVSMAYPKWYVIAPSFAFAGATAYSRMYRGAHYPTDVLCGMIVGSGTAYLTNKLQKFMFRDRARERRLKALAMTSTAELVTP
ncbi:phosphatase PAP2 family protein [Mucilaginibacter daejeonensis]|uniref:phosphatase PAP2 family protein n=1 Tax=Mucilaginibacter daejeonensis TaxID=398049 RepID=UPI001D17CBC8|nr:phosphatase PAP2 family protein [Mucilaginibacter daejeonensis]UEG52405.1 phosphatase PAP2 family protein [Mucilaginibacter daejeonensis]